MTRGPSQGRFGWVGYVQWHRRSPRAPPRAVAPRLWSFLSASSHGKGGPMKLLEASGRSNKYHVGIKETGRLMKSRPAEFDAHWLGHRLGRRRCRVTGRSGRSASGSRRLRSILCACPNSSQARVAHSRGHRPVGAADSRQPAAAIIAGRRRRRWAVGDGVADDRARDHSAENSRTHSAAHAVGVRRRRGRPRSRGQGWLPRPGPISVLCMCLPHLTGRAPI